MPRRRFVNKKKKYNAKRKYKSHPKQIQASTYIPKTRVISFSDYRTFVVDDNQGLVNSYPPTRTFTCNDPTQTFATAYLNGDWMNTSLTAKTQQIPGLADWVCENTGLPATGTRGMYKQAQALSSKITITAVPCPEQDSQGADSVQDTVKMILTKTTEPASKSIYYNVPISATNNAEVNSQRPYTTTALLYRNHGGTPRGGTVSQKYSYKAMNAGNIRTNNIFHANGTTAQQDTWCLQFAPIFSSKYGNVSGGTRLPQLKVSVKISYYVLLSEPSTILATPRTNEGLAIPDFATVADIGSVLAPILL